MDMSVEKINAIKQAGPLDLSKIHQVMTSREITRAEKIQFIKENHTEIKHLANEKISESDFKALMINRPLKLFKPIKNKFTKAGDKKLLAIALNISPGEVDNYVEKLTLQLETMETLDELGISGDAYDKVKTYVYRHGSKEQVVVHLDYELRHATDILKTLYNTLDYHSCGVANYFLRPIHRLDNNTLINIYNTIDKNLKISYDAGKVSETQALDIAEWALAKIYELQNNQRFHNAIKLKEELG